MNELINNFHLPSAILGMITWMITGLIISFENWMIEKAKNEIIKRKENYGRKKI